MEWLKQIAPTVASALGGPLAGMAVSAISKAIGSGKVSRSPRPRMKLSECSDLANLQEFNREGSISKLEHRSLTKSPNVDFIYIPQISQTVSLASKKRHNEDLATQIRQMEARIREKRRQIDKTRL